MEQPRLFDDLPDRDAPATPPDQPARDFAVDPANVVVLEASAGTGKTRVLVDRYVRLLEAGVDPRHILAVTFTRKAAAEMRDRVLVELGRRADRGEIAPDLWRALRERVADVQISTIDAFCFGLLREFPLEADVDPAFDVADETEMARFANEALDLTFRAARALVVDDEHVRLLFAKVKAPVLRDGLALLLDRRQVALPAVAAFVAARATCPNAVAAGEAFVARLRDLFGRSPDRAALIEDGPRRSPEFQWLHDELSSLDAFPAGDPVRVQALRRRLERHFLTKDLKARRRLTVPADQFVSTDARRRHEGAVQQFAPAVLDAMDALDTDLNGLLARGLLRVLAVAVDRYERLLDEHAVLDFAGMLARSVALLERQEEFARSRLKLQSRYHHLLVDEFQDTSRLQWRLVELLVGAWGEGEGGADAPTSIFVVGDRKQSIYRFRHAEATLLDEAARRIAALRPGRSVRQAITHSFRAVPELLAFVNALATDVQSGSSLADRFRYEASDRFHVAAVAPGALRDGEPVLGLVAEPSMSAVAEGVAAEVARLLGHATVRGRDGLPRPARPDDIAILFRARAGHQYYEEALEARGVRTYVYKGLGFFDAAEVQDLQALMRYLAQPDSDLRAAELLRSRLIRLSDVALAAIAPDCARALRAAEFDPASAGLDAIDRDLLGRARASLAVWLPLADRVPPGELMDRILADSAYAFEMRGRRLDQARENVKKARALVRRVESRGYATLGRLARYFETLRAGEESNAIVAASGCVNLMTIHAAKGLEFPIVFVVNLHVSGRGRSPGFTVIDRDPQGEPEVAFGATDATRIEDQRESEELRRLLYVAVTRARDRLYLAAEVDHGRLKVKRGARSLASLLPEGLAATVARAASPGSDRETWESSQGAFTFRACHPAAPAGRVPDTGPAETAPRIDLAPVAFGGRTPVAVTAASSAPARRFRTAPPSDPAADRLVGTIVHRLFQRNADPAGGESALGAVARRLARADEVADAGDLEAVGRRAVAAFVRLRGRPEVDALLRGGRAYYEVPISFLAPDRPTEVIRGAIDCVVESPDGALTVVEIKTGQRRPEHDAQAGVYAQALRAACPGRDVAVRILYA